MLIFGRRRLDAVLVEHVDRYNRRRLRRAVPSWLRAARAAGVSK